MNSLEYSMTTAVMEILGCLISTQAK